MRRLTLVVTWVLVTAGAMGAAWSIVSRISAGGTDSRPRVLSQEAVKSALLQPTSTTTATSAPTGPAAPTTTTVPVTAAPSGATTTQAPAHPVTTQRAVTTTSTPAASPATTLAPSPPTTLAQPSPTPTSTTAPAGTSSVVTSIGGVATVSCSASQIRLVSSNPRNGFSEYIMQSGPDQVEVRYQSSNHRSEIKAQCSNGQPVSEVEESNSGGDH